ncbi:MAG: kelch repeat-containing protein [Sandaracinaceae bacterium]
MRGRALLLCLTLSACADPAALSDAALMTDAGRGEAISRDAGSEPDAGEAPWREETPIPVRIQEIAVEAHEGRVWVAGGFDARAAVVASVRIYDPVARTWSDGPELPAPRHHMALVSHGGDLYALGGMQTAAFEPLDTAWVLRAGSDAWAPVAALPRDRGAMAAASVGDVIVLVGGNESRGGLATETLIYEPSADRWSFGAPIPTEREHLAAVAVDGALHVLAGRRNSLGSAGSEHEIYDPVADAWRVGPPLPYPRGGFGAARLGDAIYAIGGEEPDQVLDTVDAFDLATGTWRAAPPTRVPHHGFGAAAIGGRIYVVAGASTPAFGAIDVVESYAP